MICQACGAYYGHHYAADGTPQVTAKAHVVTRARSGVLEGDLALCLPCHQAAHQHGWDWMAQRYPMIAWRLAQARERTFKDMR